MMFLPFLNVLPDVYQNEGRNPGFYVPPLASTCSIMAGKGMRRVIADCGQSRTQELQCQHSSGYLTSGAAFGLPRLKTSVGQIWAHRPHGLHF
jgi:hypothetical protein